MADKTTTTPAPAAQPVHSSKVKLPKTPAEMKAFDWSTIMAVFGPIALAALQKLIENLMKKQEEAKVAFKSAGSQEKSHCPAHTLECCQAGIDHQIEGLAHSISVYSCLSHEDVPVT